MVQLVHLNKNSQRDLGETKGRRNLFRDFFFFTLPTARMRGVKNTMNDQVEQRLHEPLN